MKKFNSFYVIGTIGVIVTALLHMLLAFIVKDSSVHATFFVMYPVFITFLILGVSKMMQKQKEC